MTRLLIVTLLLHLAGCTTFKEMQLSASNRYDASRKLSSAQLDMAHGRLTAASATMEGLVAEPGVTGVTDEALFRLSVLKLSHEEKDGSLAAIRYLERLRSEYRDSAWTQQAKPLLDFLTGVADMKKQNRNLKNSNTSLARDNKELRLSIERLKELDLQLEQRPR